MLEGKLQISPEYKSTAERILAEQEAEIKLLLADASKHLGEGRTAVVCFLNSNSEVCLKVYKKPEDITEADFYLPPTKEQEFLNSLQNLASKARVPKVYACLEAGGTGSSFLMMEALSAVSVDDVLQGRAELPKNFNFSSFRSDLLDFVSKMHALNIYHRDLHEGNVMIDKETGQVYVIDFGAAADFWGEPEPGERGPYHITKDGQDRVLTSDETMAKAVCKKLGSSLTITS